MNKKQEEYLLYLIAYALTTINPRKRLEIQNKITETYNKLGETE